MCLTTKLRNLPDLAGLSMPARLTFAAFIIVCLFGNVIGMLVLWQLSLGDWIVVPAGIGGGFILGEVALLTIWAVLGAEPSAIRFPRALAFIVFVLFSWLIGATIADDSFPYEASVIVAGLAMLLFTVVSGPFWLVRRLTGRRIAKPLAADEAIREQFTLRHILVWTAVVAGIISLGKLILRSQPQRAGMPPLGMMLTFTYAVAVISIFVAAVGLPVVWAVLDERPSRQVWRIVIGGVFCMGPLFVHELLWLIFGQTPSSTDRVAGLMAWYGFCAAAIIMTGIGLLLARMHGYRFIEIGLPESERAVWYQARK